MQALAHEIVLFFTTEILLKGFHSLSLSLSLQLALSSSLRGEAVKEK